MRPLVIGGSGFIGGAICRALLAEKEPVRVTRRRTSNTLLLRKLPVEQMTASLEDTESLQAAMADRDVVFFAAGHYPRTSLDPEADVARARDGARNVVDACLAAGIQRLVVLGSAASAGHAKQPATAYHRIKAAVEQEAETGRARGLETVILRAGGCLGEGDVKAATGYLIVGLAHGALEAYPDGTSAMLDVDDAARASVRIARLDRPRPLYYLGGHTLPVRELLELIAAELGVEQTGHPMAPEQAADRALEQERRWVEGGSRPSLPRAFVDIVHHWVPLSSSDTLTELGLELQELQPTIARACAWYARRGYLGRSSWKPSTSDSRSATT